MSSNVTTEEALARLNSDPNFICIKRFDYSLKRLLERFPDGAPNRTIAAALMITPEDVEQIYEDVVTRLRAALVADMEE